jgi:hypothetical protein
MKGAVLNLQGCKQENPEYICIYANINADTEKKLYKVLIKKLHIMELK